MLTRVSKVNFHTVPYFAPTRPPVPKHALTVCAVVAVAGGTGCVVYK
jgi:hypothetical protein